MSSLNRMSDPNLIQFSHVNLLIIHPSSAPRPNPPCPHDPWSLADDLKGKTDDMNLSVFEDFEGFFWLWSRMTFFEEILIWVRSFLICNKRFKKEIFQPVLWHAVSSSHKIRPSSWPIKSHLTYRGCQNRKFSVSSEKRNEKRGWRIKRQKRRTN